MKPKYFLNYTQKSQRLVVFNVNCSKTLYLIVWISYKFDFKESPLNGKLDSVLWYLRDTENVKIYIYAFS